MPLHSRVLISTGAQQIPVTVRINENLASRAAELGARTVLLLCVALRYLCAGLDRIRFDGLVAVGSCGFDADRNRRSAVDVGHCPALPQL